MLLHVACCLWDANDRSRAFSLRYDETWVEKLYRGFARNLTRPFRFVVFTDRKRTFGEPLVEQIKLKRLPPDYGSLIEPFRLDVPSIIVGIDTVVVGTIDHLADHCMTATRLALPRVSGISNNGVVLVPAGCRHVHDEWRGENDMEWLRRQPHDAIDQLWPSHVVSFKLHVRPNGLGDARIVYMHGDPKMDQLGHIDWVRDHWR